MDLALEQREQLKRLVDDTPCDRRHECFRTALEKLREVEWAAGEEVLFCRDKDGPNCRNSMQFGQAAVCQCPVRLYIAKHFRR